MTTTSSRLLFLVLCASSSAVFAQTVTPADSGAASATGKKKNRAISNETSSALSAGYSYQPPKPVEAVDEDELVDQRDVDKPRNEIIRLPKYMVEGVKPPVFAEHNLYTKEGLAKLAMNRYLGGGLNKYPLFPAGQEYSMQMYWDEQRLQNMMESDRHVSLYRIGGDEARAAQTEKENKSMFLRVNEDKSQRMSEAMGQRY